MNQLPLEKRALILRCMCEGMTMRGAARTAAVSKNTVAKLLVEAGAACQAYQDRVLRDLPCQRFQADEIWSWIYAKEKNVPTAKAPPPEAGDVWTWTVICADTKLVPVWRVGDRSLDTALALFSDLRTRVRHRVQIVADGNSSYLEAVPAAFGREVDFAMLVKLYGDPEHVMHVSGRVEPGTVNTCFIERHNWTMRTMRRFTRRSNGFSRKLANHRAMVALFLYAYNFVEPHRTLTRKGGPPTTPAMAAGITDWPGRLTDVVEMLETPN